ncbi:hypothetical protein [Clostridium sp. UBA7503]|uniref:hypothetical protein n=1 Tax=Clostridium sp. UBA7503 TaxID=1946377 RepID=UPI003217CDE6
MKIIDTFKDYKGVMEENLNKEPKEKMELWEKFYNSNFPEMGESVKKTMNQKGITGRK